MLYFNHLEVKKNANGWEMYMRTPSAPGAEVCVYNGRVSGLSEDELRQYIGEVFNLIPELDTGPPHAGHSYWHEGSLCTPGLSEIGQELS
jgi:hypothetical protein